MKIAIEAQRIFRPNKHGMDFVALETIRELQKIDCENEYFILVSPGEDRCLSEAANFHIVEIACPTYPLWEQVALPIAVSKIKPDCLHCTSNTAPVFCNVPLILTLHDIIFLEPRQDGNKSWYQNMGRIYRKIVVPIILRRSKKIITVSHFECNRIKTALHLSEEQITAVYNGFNSHFRPLEDIRSVTGRYIPDEDYFFFLGNTDPKKNTLGTLKAYSLYLKNSSVKRSLLVADLKADILDDMLKAAGIEDIKPYIYCPGYIPNSDLVYLYNGAFAFLYTSFRESFGIPLLESMACGTPVITSNTSAIPEIAGNGGIFTDPFSPEDIAEKMIALEENETLYNNAVIYGLQRVKLFSWKNTADSLLELYKSFREIKKIN
ncbi:glycosyltransferase family 4 protein [Coprobacter tertius]|uniref:Glycosyltransferase family 4 protein n=1 Tax=Coprobacter tertius TaxID=2944915 RepID=A0ABT1ME89_9BACT|nr:glycosyltransferase family 1 protein [Coprobacter tertius]MCP9610937.1 glycosyltransferase family 4 protein [Coprobacter tertius]